MKKHPPHCVALLFAAFLSLLAPLQTSAQEKAEDKGTRPSMATMTAEEQREALAKRIQSVITAYIDEMGDLAPREDQIKEFTQIMVSAQVEKAKIMMEMRALREKNSGRPDRDAMMAIRGKGEKIDSQTLKSMKALLGKDQLKAFKKALEKLNPQPRAQRGGAGGGGGMRGSGGGGGMRGSGGGGGMRGSGGGDDF